MCSFALVEELRGAALADRSVEDASIPVDVLTMRSMNSGTHRPSLPSSSARARVPPKFSLASARSPST